MTKQRLPILVDERAASAPGLTIHARWLAGALADPWPTERHATCGTCAMAKEPDAQDEIPPGAFNPDTKCCTFTPTLPNFLVGAALVDSTLSPFGRRSLLDRIAARRGVSPFGVAGVPAVDPQRFGRDPALRCPHYDHGACGIWAHRDAVCTTYYCKHERGARSYRLWRAIREALACIEQIVARAALLRIGGLPDALFAADAERARLPYEALWGSWAKGEPALYAATAETVAAMSWEEVQRLGGAALAWEVEAVRRAEAALGAPLPERLVPGKMMVTAGEAGGFSVAAYSPLDPVPLDSDVLAALRRFDGRPRGEVLAEIAREDRIRLEEEVVETLCDLEILVPAPT
ncbi:MAG TPA: hypothetical protein VGI39_30425 [Polyangiaceae bacterium]